MLILKTVKNIGVGFIVSAALIGSANAYNINGLGHVGLGGFYLANNGNDVKSSYSGGYIDIGGVDRYFSDKLQLGAYIKVGYGYNQVDFSNISNAQGLYLDLIGKIGFNLFTQDVPLFINVTFGIDSFSGFRRQGMSRTLSVLGAELDGRLPVSANTSILYGGGYNWIPIGSYGFGDDKGVRLDGYNYSINAHLGVSTKLNEKISFYVKAAGKYYGLNNSKEFILNGVQTIYPESKSWLASFEMGFEF